MAACLKPSLKGFIFTEKLGQGTYATVYKAFRKGENREVVAVKCVDKSNLTKAAQENLLREIEIMQKVKNDFIVDLKDFQWDSHNIYLIMEYCSGGDLSKFIHQKRHLPESVVRRFLQQIAQALQVLRLNDICHMDLKPQNILLTSSANPTLKLADFGFAQYLRLDEEAVSLRGSPLYMAPEILLQHQYDASVDLWSIGIILFECLFGQAPFSSNTFAELAEKIKNKKAVEIPYGVSISEQCRDLILRLLERDPKRRITFQDFFEHPFVDLEHMPNQESYQKGVQLVQAAVQADGKGETAEASQLYCQGLLYLVPIVNVESNRTKREALRQKVCEYLARAEDLKLQMKSSDHCEPSISTTSQPYEQTFQGLRQMANDDYALKQAMEKAQKADYLMLADEFSNALEMYQSALEVMVQTVKVFPPGPCKEALHKEVLLWLSKAEEAKSCSLVQKLQTNEVLSDIKRGTMASETLGHNCNLQ